MKHLLFALLLMCVVGCDGVTIDFGEVPDFVPSSPRRPDVVYPDYAIERPTVNLEEVFRQANWPGSEGGGSCVHASMIMLFRWQGHEDLADLWKATYEDGEWPSGLAKKFDAQNVRYAYTSKENDVSFIEWACATRRGCGVTVRGAAHMVLIVYMDDKEVGILDNNYIEEIKWVPRQEFLNEWMNSESWAVTPLMGPPPPPLPYEGQKK